MLRIYKHTKKDTISLDNILLYLHTCQHALWVNHHFGPNIAVGLHVALEGVEGDEALGAHCAGKQLLVVGMIFNDMPDDKTRFESPVSEYLASSKRADQDILPHNSKFRNNLCRTRRRSKLFR